MSNKYFLQLEKEFGKYGSWALWDKDGKIEPFVQIKNSVRFIKDSINPNIVFMGLNASRDLKKEIDWANYHSDLKPKKGRTWKKASCRRLAEIIQQKEFFPFRGAYMTDIIKTRYDSTSGKLKIFLKTHKSILNKNKKLLEREMKMLQKISGSNKFVIICIGDDSFEITKQILGTNENLYKIPHYAMRGIDDEIREKIQQGLIKIIKKL